MMADIKQCLSVHAFVPVAADFRFQASNDIPPDTAQLMPGDSLITE
jgi:hypothetical protein